jgi:catechol 2,3-dioxygenase-like lactoylglutathione lyase family enzyme
MVLAKQIFANTLFIADKELSKEFYVKAFGLGPVYEDENSVVFKFGETLINLLVESEAPGLIAPALVASKDAGSRFQLTLQVQDVDAECARLGELEIPLVNGPVDRPWGVRTALFADPDGHLWELAQ